LKNARDRLQRGYRQKLERDDAALLWAAAIWHEDKRPWGFCILKKNTNKQACEDQLLQWFYKWWKQLIRNKTIQQSCKPWL
jgi:hypothetical protein